MTNKINKMYSAFDDNVVCYNGTWYIRTDAGNAETANELLTQYKILSEYNLRLRSRIGDRIQEIHRMADVVKGLSESKGKCELCGKDAIALCSKECAKELMKMEKAHTCKQQGVQKQ